MKQHLISVASWMNADPRRFRFLSVSLTLALTLVTLAVPGGAATMGWAAGGSD